METKSEVFLGQKKSIARYDLEKKKPTWALINGKQSTFIIC